jgi:hypothetical protein
MKATPARAAAALSRSPRRGRGRVLAAAFVVATFLTAAPAQAKDPARAKDLFNAGAHAYSLGAFAAAARAFEDAYAEDPQPAILFSLSQARRRQFVVEPRREIAALALAGFEQYLRLVPQGGRRADAAAAVEELRLTLASLPAEEATTPPRTPSNTASLIVSSPTPGATLSLDGQEAFPLPYVGEVSPGLHVVSVDSPGFFPSKREVLFPKGGLATLDVPLVERPSTLAVDARPGTQILVDGRPLGVTPLTGPLEVPAGRHIVTLLQRGRESVAEEIDTERGETKRVSSPQPLSARRLTAYGFLGVGAAGVLTGTAFAFVAVAKKGSADDLLHKRDTVGLSPSERSDYADARDGRDRYRAASAITIASSAAAIAVGGFLYFFEEPSAGGVPVRFSPTKRAADRPTAPAAAPGTPTAQPRSLPEVSVAPLLPSLTPTSDDTLARGTWGAAVFGRF